MKTALLGFLITTVMTVSAAPAATLDTVRENGRLVCGVSQGNPGFSNPDSNGVWSGFDVDYCRAVAAAIFGDPQAVTFRPLSSPERFTALQSGEIDLLSRTTTWTMSRDTALGANFVGVMYYDGQAMMVRKDLGVKSALELSNSSICSATGTTTELNVADFFRLNNMPYELVAFEKNDEVAQAYDAGRCDVYTTDASGLAANRQKLTDPQAHVILPEIISKEPLGPVVRQGDDQWFNIARWVLNALINAEELGVTRANVDDMKTTENPAIRRLIGMEGAFGDAIGLDNAWAYNVIRHVGNYGEIFDRNVGPDSPIGVSRGLNALWTDGGLIYAPPVR